MKMKRVYFTQLDGGVDNHLRYDHTPDSLSLNQKSKQSLLTKFKSAIMASLFVASVGLFLGNAPMVSAHEEDTDHQELPPICADNTTSTIASKHMELIGQLSFACNGIELGDVDVSKDGKTVYLGTSSFNDGVLIVDVSDPTNPLLINQIAKFEGSTSEDVAVLDVGTDSFKGRILVTGIQYDRQGLDIWDVTDPKNPIHKAFFDVNALFGTGGLYGLHEVFILERVNPTTQRKQVLVSASNYRSLPPRALLFPEFKDIGETMFIDITDPEHPFLAGSWSPSFVGLPEGDPDGTQSKYDFGPPTPNARWPAPFDCKVAVASPLDPFARTNGCRAPFTEVFAHSVSMSRNGNIAYVSEWDLGAIILDTSDLSDIKFLGLADNLDNTAGNLHSAIENEPGNLMVTTREVFDFADPLTAKMGTAEIWDIRDPSKPLLLSVIEPPAAALSGTPIHNPVIKGATLYLAAYLGGVRVYNIGNPNNPKEIAFLEPGSPTAFGGAVWGVAVHGSLLFATGETAGLIVMKKTGK